MCDLDTFPLGRIQFHALLHAAGGIDCLNIRLFFNRQADTVLDIGYLF